MSFSSILQSSFCCRVARTVRRAYFSISSAVPDSLAAAWPASACALRATRFASSPDLSVGGLPSKTYTGLCGCQWRRQAGRTGMAHFIPLSIMRSVR